MNTAKACGIHLGAVMVASEEGAEKENRFLVNSPFMQDYMMKCLGLEKILLSQIHQGLGISERGLEEVVIPLKGDKKGQGCTKLLKDMLQGLGTRVGEHSRLNNPLKPCCLLMG